MSISRRKLLGMSALAGIGLAACGPQDRERAPGDLSDLDQGTFASEIGSGFQLVNGPHLFETLTLTKVTDLRRKDSPAQGEVFSALFTGPLEKPLKQDVYRLEHPRLGGMTLLVVPLRPRADAALYEAVFNRQSLSLG
jgi:hypothetical protein